MWPTNLLILTVLLVQVYSAPQLISFSEGKLGVNFGGYHAGVGIGGQGGAGRTAGGLFAEAGTPFGPAAKAGLGGAVDGNSGSAGGLFAGATAGGNVNAAAGLGGAVGAGKAAGGGYSFAQSGGHSSSSVLGGESEVSGSSGFLLSSHKSIGVPTTVVQEQDVSVVPVEEIKTVHKKANFEATNEIIPVANAGFEANANVNVESNAPSSALVKEVHVEPTPVQVIVHKQKPHHVHKTVFIGGSVGAAGEVGAPVSKTVIVQTGQPIDKRIDIQTQGHGGTEVKINGQNVGPGKVVTFSNSKEIVVTNNSQAKPNTFFQDIFNIPISALKAVSGFLTNTAGSTSVSVQKSASVQAGGYAGHSGHSGYSGHKNTDSITSKHASPSSSSSSEAHISVQTPSASKIIDDIFSIPIDTLSAVNKFLDNNVSRRKRIQVTEGVEEPTRIRLGPHARRRANKQIVIFQEPANQQSQESN